MQQYFTKLRSLNWRINSFRLENGEGWNERLKGELEVYPRSKVIQNKTLHFNLLNTYFLFYRLQITA